MSRIARHAIQATAALLLAQFASAANAETLVKDVRVGEHPGSTRVVLDISEPTDLKFNLSADGRTLSVIMPDTRWKAGDFASRHAQGYLADYRFTPVGSGGTLELSMNAPVQMKKPFFVTPEGNLGNRVVIDLVPDPMRAVGAPTRSVLASAAPTKADPTIQVVQAAAARPIPDGMEPPRDVAMQARAARLPTPVEVAAATPVSAQSVGIETAQAQVQTPRAAAPAAPAMAAAAPPASTQGGEFYVKLSAGLTKLMEADASGGSGTNAAVETDLGYNVVGGLGMEIKGGFRVEGEGLYMANDVKSIKGTMSGASVNSAKGSGSVTTTALMANLAYDFVGPYPMTPYVFGGAGLAHISLDGVTATGASTTLDDSDTVFAFQAGLGVSTDLTDRLGVEAQYRYFETLDPELADSSGAPFTYENMAHMFMLGLRYKF